jgi:hypothetical protein
MLSYSGTFYQTVDSIRLSASKVACLSFRERFIFLFTERSKRLDQFNMRTVLVKSAFDRGPEAHLKPTKLSPTP